MKKAISLLFSVVLLFSVTTSLNYSAFAFDSTGSCGTNVSYSFDSSSGTLTISGTGDMYDEGWDSPFKNSSEIKKVIIEEGVTNVGEQAFWRCEHLNSVVIPNGVSKIGSNAFYSCGELTNVALPDSVRTVSYGAFTLTGFYNNANNWENDVLYIGKHLISAKTTITDCVIKEGTITIGENAFSCCHNLYSITIPFSVTRICECAFEYCDGLIYVNYMGTQEEWKKISLGRENSWLKEAIFNYNYVPPCNSHITVVDKAVPATFKKAGKTAGSHCSVCGAVIVAQQTVAKLGIAKLSKVKAAKRKFTAIWKAVDGIDGYEIQYSLKKNMKSSNKKIVKGTEKEKLTVKKLKTKKLYYVRIRAFKTINNKKYYSKWSTKKKVKIK